MPCRHSVPPPRSPHPATGFPPLPASRYRLPFLRLATGFAFRHPVHSASPRSLLYTPTFRPRQSTLTSRPANQSTSPRIPLPAPIPPPRSGTSIRLPATGVPFRRPTHSTSPRSLLHTPTFRPRPGTPFRPPVPDTPLPTLRPSLSGTKQKLPAIRGREFPGLGFSPIFRRTVISRRKAYPAAKSCRTRF